MRSVISHYSLPDSFRGEALKTTVYILIRVPSKVVDKNPFDLWNGKNPNLRHQHIWGCSAEIGPYRSREGKLHAETNIYYLSDTLNALMDTIFIISSLEKNLKRENLDSMIYWSKSTSVHVTPTNGKDAHRS